MTPTENRYIIVTPAHNEADYIENTIRSVIAQTVKPVVWIIVSDRSTDGTDELVQGYARRYPFIEFVRKDRSDGRNTASKVHAINLGLTRICGRPHEYLGNLDADVSFEPDYFERLIGRFKDDPALGVAGGRIHQMENGRAVEHASSLESVAGAVQLFRRECFAQIGGYLPLKGGFEDGVAEISARLHGWRTRSFRDLVVLHHREIGTVGRSLWRTRFNAGVNEYLIGFDYLYHLLRALYRLPERPIILGSALVVLGFHWALVRRQDKAMPDEFIAFMRREQRQRMVQYFFKRGNRDDS